MKLIQAAAALLSFSALVAGKGGKGCGPGKPKPWINSKKLQAEIKTDKLMSHLQAFDGIAKANGGNRAFGLPGYSASVDYVWDLVSRVPGTKAWKQEFEALFNLVESIELKVDGENIYVFGLTYSPSTSPEGITAEIVAGPDGAAGCEDSSYDDLDVAGKIVLVQRFRCPTGGTLAGRLLPAARAGAAAVIIYNDAITNVTAGTLSAPSDEHVPGGFINLADGERIKERLAAGERLEAYFQQTQLIELRPTHNVFVETDEGDPDNVIVVSEPVAVLTSNSRLLTHRHSSERTWTASRQVPVSMTMAPVLACCSSFSALRPSTASRTKSASHGGQQKRTDCSGRNIIAQRSIRPRLIRSWPTSTLTWSAKVTLASEMPMAARTAALRPLDPKSSSASTSSTLSARASPSLRRF
ncbi:hypothetical protein VTK26DRAFT_772 [Humicola hyalothermophila]